MPGYLLTVDPFCNLEAQSRYLKVRCVVSVPLVTPNGRGMAWHSINQLCFGARLSADMGSVWELHLVAL